MIFNTTSDYIRRLEQENADMKTFLGFFICRLGEEQDPGQFTVEICNSVFREIERTEIKHWNCPQRNSTVVSAIKYRRRSRPQRDVVITSEDPSR